MRRLISSASTVKFASPLVTVEGDPDVSNASAISLPGDCRLPQPQRSPVASPLGRRL